MNIVPIAFAFDNNLIMPACIAISSLLMNANKDTFYDIFILHSSKEPLLKEELNKISKYYKQCKITYREVDDSFEKAFEIRGITVSTYYRLLIPALIREYDTIVYSDVDVIFRSDLFNIYSTTNLNGYYIAGVNSLSAVGNQKVYYMKVLKLRPEEIIYAGNVIFNSKKILEDNLIMKFKSLVKNNYKYQDMDIINISCHGAIKYLPPSFCLTTDFSEMYVYNRQKLESLWSAEELKEAIMSGIVHYNGQKPWKGVCINFDIWWEYYRKSHFYKEKFYFDFFNNKLNEFDRLSLCKRIKILFRYFIFGRR